LELDPGNESLANGGGGEEKSVLFWASSATGSIDDAFVMWSLLR
jgi:hypothetical protein